MRGGASTASRGSSSRTRASSRRPRRSIRTSRLWRWPTVSPSGSAVASPNSGTDAMKMRGSDLVVRALEDAGARFTFGIPGTHNIELYDALDRSQKVTPVLVTDEQSASFMADAVSRTSDVTGVVNVVPGAGLTHALSGIAEALLDNVPMVVLACGIRTDTGKAFQLHDIDQAALLRPVTKAVLQPAAAGEIYTTVRRAFDLARSGTPGPVAVIVPAE